MKISSLLRYQAGYMLLGLIYNLVSLIMKASGGSPLSSKDPVTGIAAMLVFGLFLIPGFLQYHMAYRILMGISVLVLGYTGVVAHLLNYANLQLYYSTTAWILAILINFFGVVLNALAAAGKFRLNGAPLSPASSDQERRHG